MMALPANKTPDELIPLTKTQLFDYFLENARMIEDSPNPKSRYGIRFGSKTLRDADTYDLRKKFESAVKAHARKRANR